MKPRHLTSLFAAGALLLPTAVYAQSSSLRQDDRSTFGANQSQPFGTSPNANRSTSAADAARKLVQHVNEDEMNRAFTARDLIGKTVTNHNGERLGTINDVGLGRAWTERFGLPQQTEQRTYSTDTWGANASTLDPELHVYVSTGGPLGLGGRLGLGADWVSVSGDSLLYDRQNDRFILNMTQQEFTSIAQGGGAGSVATATDSTFPSAAPSTVGNNPIGGTIGAPTATNVTQADLRRIENALMDHSELRGRAQIEVSRSGNAIQLTGTVPQAHLIRRAGDIAREHTALEVRNLLEVSSPFATE